MKNIMILLLCMAVSLSIADAQSIAWTQSYENRIINYSYYPYMEDETKVYADYNQSGSVFAAGTDANGQIKINKIDPATGAVIASHTELNVYASANRGSVYGLKVFRHPTLTNYVYVLGRESDGWFYDIVIMQYDDSLNLLHKRYIEGLMTYPGKLEVDPVNGNPVISYRSGGHFLKRLNLNLSDQWTRTLPSFSYEIFRFCPNKSWMILVSGSGMQRITASNVTQWTVPSVTSVEDIDLDNKGNIFIANRGPVASLISKYNQNGALIFNNSYTILNLRSVLCKADNSGGVFLGEVSAYFLFYSVELHTLKRISSSGTLLFNQNLPASANMVYSGLYYTNNNVFVVGYYGAPSSYIGVDSGLVYKYSSSGSFVYRNSFSPSTAGPFSSIVGIHPTGIVKSGTGIIIVGQQMEDGTSSANRNFSWYLRKYGPVARIADAYVEPVNEDLNTFSVYPVPTKDILNIEGIHENSKYIILDVSGRIVQSGILSNESEILDIRVLRNGTYFLKVDEENNSITKIIIKN